MQRHVPWVLYDSSIIISWVESLFIILRNYYMLLTGSLRRNDSWGSNKLNADYVGDTMYTYGILITMSGD